MGRRVLLVVDEEVVRALSDLLAPRYEVSAFTSPNEALARVEAGVRFDAVIVDVDPGEMSGATFIKRLRAMAPDLAQRAVILTGHQGSNPSLAGFPLVAKPGDADVLLQAVARAVGHYTH